MYLSVCKKEFNGIKAGELFDTYQRINYVFIREKGSNQEFQSLSFQEYSSYFIEFEDYVFLPIIQKEIKLVGLFKKREEIVYERVDELLNFDKMHFDDLVQMQLSVIEPIHQLSKIDGFENYTGDLYEELKQIVDFQKIGLFSRVEIQEKIKRIEVIVKDIEIEIKKQLLDEIKIKKQLSEI